MKIPKDQSIETSASPQSLELIEYYKRRIDELAGDNLKLDYRVSTLSHELRQKRQGLNLISDFLQLMRLKQEVGSEISIDAIYASLVASAKKFLVIDHFFVFLPTATRNQYRLEYGATNALLRELILTLDLSAFGSDAVILANGASEKTETTTELRHRLSVPYFVCVPVHPDSLEAGFFIAGRNSECRPHFPPLDSGDADTLRALGGLVSLLLENREMHFRLSERRPGLINWFREKWSSRFERSSKTTKNPK